MTKKRQQEFVYPKSDVLSRLQQFRKELALSQTSVERSLGWRRGSLYDFEQGRVSLSVEACWQLLQLYGKDWTSLFRQTSHDQIEAPIHDRQIEPLIGLGIIAPRTRLVLSEMRQDPILVAELGLDAIKNDQPVLTLLLKRLTPAQQRDYFLELCRYINATISADHRIHHTERQILKMLDQFAPINIEASELASLKRAFEGNYFGGSVARKFPRDAYKHFLIWLLFIVALADQSLNHQELIYIKQVAEHIHLDLTSFYYITERIKIHEPESF